MTTYIVRRLIQALVVLILVTLLIFIMMHMLEGDPIYAILSSDQLAGIPKEQIEEIRHEWGLDKPVIVQYFNWVSRIVRGDLGQSITQGQSVFKELSRRVPITLDISLRAFIIGTIIGVLAGLVCAVKRGSWTDNVVTVLANLGLTIPSFWLGLILVYVFSIELHWLPVQGYTSPLTDIVKNTRQLILPVLCLSTFPIAAVARQTRSSMLEVMHQDYVRTAWSKGLSERFVILRHVLKNGILPVITLSGIQLGYIIGGSVLIETVFNIPGMGRMVVSAISSRDYPLVQGFVLLIAFTVLLVNIIVDISYCWIDPRIRYE